MNKEKLVELVEKIIFHKNMIIMLEKEVDEMTKGAGTQGTVVEAILPQGQKQKKVRRKMEVSPENRAAASARMLKMWADGTLRKPWSKVNEAGKVLRGPNNELYPVFSLTAWVQEKVQLFSPGDVSGAKANTWKARTRLAAVLAGNVKEWNGWTLVSNLTAKELLAMRAPVLAHA